MATCINESDLIPENALNQTLSSEKMTFDYVINTLFLFVSMFGIVGNILNLTILTRRKLKKSIGSLEQAANLCIIALAVSDLMFCVLVFLFTFLPQDIYHGKGFFYVYKLYSTAFINLFIMESTMLTVAMALERYILICLPFRKDLYLTTKGIKCIIVGSFIFSIAFNIPVLWRYRSYRICPDSTIYKTSLNSFQTMVHLNPSFTLKSLVSADIKEGEFPMSPPLPRASNTVSPHLSSLYSKSLSSKPPSSLTTSSHQKISSMSPLSAYLYPSSGPSSTSTPSSLPPSPSLPKVSLTGDNDIYIIKQVPLWGSPVYDFAYRICWAIVGNFIPLALLFYFNVCLCCDIYRSSRLHKEFNNQNQIKSSRHILTVTLVFIIAMYFILVAPSEIILAAGASGTTESILNLLQCLNYSLDFILYSIVYRHFRKTLKHLCLCFCSNA